MKKIRKYQLGAIIHKRRESCEINVHVTWPASNIREIDQGLSTKMYQNEIYFPFLSGTVIERENLSQNSQEFSCYSLASKTNRNCLSVDIDLKSQQS